MKQTFLCAVFKQLLLILNIVNPVLFNSIILFTNFIKYSYIYLFKIIKSEIHFTLKLEPLPNMLDFLICQNYVSITRTFKNNNNKNLNILKPNLKHKKNSLRCQASSWAVNACITISGELRWLRVTRPDKYSTVAGAHGGPAHGKERCTEL